ncbi:MAG: hypothetical protein OXE55_04035 [Flavobacteriaceae bacterium]|nr:hypothetical protein [Flavobacteriaceae bacterium]
MCVGTLEIGAGIYFLIVPDPNYEDNDIVGILAIFCGLGLTFFAYWEAFFAKKK